MLFWLKKALGKISVTCDLTTKKRFVWDHELSYLVCLLAIAKTWASSLKFVEACSRNWPEYGFSFMCITDLVDGILKVSINSKYASTEKKSNSVLARGSSLTWPRVCGQAGASHRVEDGSQESKMGPAGWTTMCEFRWYICWKFQ